MKKNGTSKNFKKFQNTLNHGKQIIVIFRNTRKNSQSYGSREERHNERHPKQLESDSVIV